jgi:hypothetical protein
VIIYSHRREGKPTKPERVKAMYKINLNGYNFEEMDSYNTYEEAMADAEKYGWIGCWEYSNGESGYELVYPDGTTEEL